MLPQSPSTYMQGIVSRVRLARKARSWSQEALADRSGVSFGSVKRFETSGQISLQSLVKIGIALGYADDFNQLFEAPEVPDTLDDLSR